jgi:hypothetical protein
MTPVYPKEDPEYRKKVLENFYRRIRNTNWDTNECNTGKSRGRKPKPIVRAEVKPRTPSEALASLKQHPVKKQKYNWFN